MSEIATRVEAGRTELPDGFQDWKGQLSLYDRLIYYWAGRWAFTGYGTIVDAGALLGGTARLLGYGVSQNPKASTARILSYDRFEAPENGFIHVHIEKNMRVPLPPPADGKVDFEPAFREQTKDYANMIEVRRGDISALGYHDLEPIEILSVDVAKTPDLMLAVARDFFPELARGAYVINQDYIFPHQPWVAMAMELLADHFEAVYEPPMQSTMVHRLVRPITRELVIERLGETGRDFFKLENVPLLAAAKDKLKTPLNRAALHAAQAHALSEVGHFYAAQEAARAMLVEHAITPEMLERMPDFRRIVTELRLDT